MNGISAPKPVTAVTIAVAAAATAAVDHAAPQPGRDERAERNDGPERALQQRAAAGIAHERDHEGHVGDRARAIEEIADHDRPASARSAHVPPRPFPNCCPAPRAPAAAPCVNANAIAASTPQTIHQEPGPSASQQERRGQTRDEDADRRGRCRAAPSETRDGPDRPGRCWPRARTQRRKRLHRQSPERSRAMLRTTVFADIDSTSVATQTAVANTTPRGAARSAARSGSPPELRSDSRRRWPCS